MIMKIVQKEIEDVSVLKFKGSVVLLDNISNIDNYLSECIEKNRIKIVFDMQSTGYINSTFIAITIKYQKKLIEKKGNIKLANVNSMIRDLLYSLNLQSKIEIFPNVVKAIISFKNC